MPSPDDIHPPRDVISTWIVLDRAGDASYFPQAGRHSSSDARVQLIYWRCVAVFFAVIRRVMGDRYELRLYTNCAVDLPEAPEPVPDLLRELNVVVVSVPIEHYPPQSYTKRFRNQFYIFDVLNYIANEGDDRGHLVLDSDCVCLRPLDQLFQDLRRHGVLTLQMDWDFDMDINGLTRRQLGGLCAEMGVPLNDVPFYFGGEFFATTGEQARRMNVIAEDAYQESLRRNERGESKFTEEAHLLSYVYYAMSVDPSGTANPYIKQIWTGVHFRNGREADWQLAIAHVPSEKRFGYVKLYNDVLDPKSWFYATPYGDGWIATAQRNLSIPRPSVVKMAGELTMYGVNFIKRKLGMK